MQDTWVQSLGQEDPLEKEMATPSSILGESHGQRSLVGYGAQGRRVGHYGSHLAHELLVVVCGI